MTNSDFTPTNQPPSGCAFNFSYSSLVFGPYLAFGVWHLEF